MGDDDKFAQSLESEYGGFERSLPNIKDLQSNKDTLISEGTSKANAALDRCYKKGWLLQCSKKHIIHKNFFVLATAYLGATYVFPRMSSSGKVDFYIKPTKWAIEYLRDGSGVKAHIDRFLPGGIYIITH